MIAHGKNKVMTEREVQLAVVAALGSMGWETTIFSVNKKSHTQLRGIPDLYTCHAVHRQQIWIECKKPGGKLRPAQERWLARTQASGALCLVIDSVDSLMNNLQKRGLV